MNRPCVFLDRDGTIIVEKHYLGDPDGVELERDVPEALSELAEDGYIFVVVSNQSGIGRGVITLDQMRAVNARVAELLAGHGITIAGWYHCPHHPDEACDCRKPGTGMILQALANHDIDMARSLIIGDKDVDVLLARQAGIEGHLVLTGHGMRHVDWARANGFAIHETLLGLRPEVSSAKG